MAIDDLSPDTGAPAGATPTTKEPHSSKAGGGSVAVAPIGIHPGVSFDEYLGWDCVSKSRLDDLARSPAYCQLRILKPDRSTDAQEFGRAAHAAILEPDLFESRYAVWDGPPRNTKAGKEAWADFLLSLGTREVIGAEERESCLRLRDSVHEHPRAAAILAAATMREVALVWVDARTGLLCKGRADALAPGLSVVADLKITRDAHCDKFPEAVKKYGIHRQACLYLAGLRALGQKAEHFAIIAVEPEEPHEVEVKDLDGITLECGEVQTKRLMDRYAECVRTGVWPKYCDAVQSVTLPEYYLRRELPEYFQK